MYNLFNIPEYLSDSKFSNNLKIKCTTYFSPLKSRIDNLISLSDKKSVVHLGCCDHMGLIDEKIAKGEWLHARLQQCTSNLIGIDINDEAIGFLRQKGVVDIIKADVTSPALIPEVSATKWDVMIAAEIIEHINNPVEFLKAVRANYSQHIDELIITVPNAFSFNNLRFALQNTEGVNTDHRYWFSPFTITKVLFQAGFKTEEVILANGHNKINLLNFPRILFTSVFPMFRDTLIVRAKFKS